MQAELKAKLPRPYYAATGRRSWIEVSERYVEPDVDVVRPMGIPGPSVAMAADPDVAVGVVIHVPHDERVEAFLEVYIDRAEGRRLVTTIEVLSPSNKQSGEHGRDLYLKNQQESLASRVNLIEIDLLRSGLHSTAVPLPRLLAQAGPFDYHACVHQLDCWDEFVVYPIRLTERLPRIPVPLRAMVRPSSICRLLSIEPTTLAPTTSRSSTGKRLQFQHFRRSRRLGPAI